MSNTDNQGSTTENKTSTDGYNSPAPTYTNADIEQGIVKDLFLKTTAAARKVTDDVLLRTADLERKVKEVTKDALELKEKLEGKIETITKENEKSKTDFIQALGLFVALFTFISVNITIFTKIEYLSAGIWFMFLMLLCLIIFSIIFHILLYKDQAGQKIWWYLIASTAILVVLFYLPLNNIKINPSPNKNSVDMFQTDIEKLNTQYDSRIKELEQRNLELERVFNSWITNKQK